MLLAISRFSASSVICIPHAQNDMQILNFNDEISILSKFDWLVLVAVMLIYCPSTWYSGPETEVELGSGLMLVVLDTVVWS